MMDNIKRQVLMVFLFPQPRFIISDMLLDYFTLQVTNFITAMIESPSERKGSNHSSELRTYADSQTQHFPAAA